MSYLISHQEKKIDFSFKIKGSKSESNRLLILKAFYKNIVIKNISNSEDTSILEKNLKNLKNKINVNHAGTAMRFLTAYLSTQVGKKFEIYGSKRMHERPIKVLVDALNSIGADIRYLENDGFPPLIIKGKKIQKNLISIPANVSSQYISALLLISPMLENGLIIKLKEAITSRPYIDMTLFFLKNIGIKLTSKQYEIRVSHTKNIKDFEFSVESDWSSLSYFYSIVSLAKKASLKISKFHKNTVQGDKRLVDIYKNLGVRTSFKGNSIYLKKDVSLKVSDRIILDLVDCPDIAQTIAVSCFGLGISCELNGLHTLKIKETDRLFALKNELEKLGASVQITDQSLRLDKSEKIKSNIKINTYEDHRMAMSFSTLAIKTPIIINDTQVIKKSFPDFWTVLKALDFKLSKIN